MTETFYKVLNANGSCYHGGKGKWYLPQGRKPGKWMPRIDGDLRFCQRGYHILRRDQLVRWLGPAIFMVEVDGEADWKSDKGIVAKARLIKRLVRWNEQTARLFACDCAERARPTDPRSVNAIRVARRFAFGLSTRNELSEAAQTARAAAEAAEAAEEAATEAAWAAWAATAATAAWAAEAAEAKAARAAARAAWAAEAAEAKAARAAAAEAAEAKAAWAARAMEIRWQTDRLFAYLDGKVDLAAIKRSVTLRGPKNG